MVYNEEEPNLDELLCDFGDSIDCKRLEDARKYETLLEILFKSMDTYSLMVPGGDFRYTTYVTLREELQKLSFN